MNLIKFILILSLFVTNARTSKLEVVEKMTEVVKAIKDIDDKDILAITHSVLNFVAVVPYIGPFAAITGEILGMFQKDDALEQGFNEMKGHLGLIEMKLDQLFGHIEAVSAMQSYKNHAEKITFIWESYTRLLDLKGKAARDDLVENCGSTMLDFATYLRAELSPDTPIPLGQAIFNKYDMKLLGSWSKQLVRHWEKQCISILFALD